MALLLFAYISIIYSLGGGLITLRHCFNVISWLFSFGPPSIKTKYLSYFFFCLLLCSVFSLVISS